MCKSGYCRICKYCCYTDRKKHPRTCLQLVMPDYLKGRLQIVRFKTSWQFVNSSEESAANTIFFMLLFALFLFSFIGCALPFLASFTSIVSVPECSSVSPLYVYAAYCGYILFSTSVEFGILINLKKSLVSDTDPLPLNSYLFVKWCQGQLSAFVTFMHFCFVASALMCLVKQDGGSLDGIEEHLMEEALEEQAKGKALELVSSVLAIIAMPILVFSNTRRTMYIC